MNGRSNQRASRDFEARRPMSLYLDRPFGRLPVGIEVGVLYGARVEADCWRHWLSALLSHSSSHFSRMTDATNRAASHQEDSLLLDARAVVEKLTLASVSVSSTPSWNSELRRSQVTMDIPCWPVGDRPSSAVRRGVGHHPPRLPYSQGMDPWKSYIPPMALCHGGWLTQRWEPHPCKSCLPIHLQGREYCL